MGIYLAIDLKSFYASVECIEQGFDPLDTNLVVADASRTEKTICLAVSPSLKKYGIPGRARLFEVIQKINQENNKRLKTSHYFRDDSILESELRKDKHLKDNIGEKIEIKLFKPINKKKEIIGILEQINEKAIIVISDNEEQEILRQDIAQIKKAYEW